MSKDLGTPETRARLEASALYIQLKRGFLLPEHVQAAFDIQDAFRAISKGVGLRMMDWEPMGIDLDRSRRMTHLNKREEELVSRYNDWVDDLSDGQVKLGYAIVMNIVEGATINQLAEAIGCAKRTVKKRLRDSLQIYCERVGSLNPDRNHASKHGQNAA